MSIEKRLFDLIDHNKTVDTGCFRSGLFQNIPHFERLESLHKYFVQKINYLLINLQKEVSGFIDIINK